MTPQSPVDFLQDLHDDGLPTEGLLQKFVLPARTALNLVGLLNERFSNWVNLMPGYQGVVQHLELRAQHGFCTST